MRKSSFVILTAATISLSCAAQTIERKVVDNTEQKPNQVLKVKKAKMGTTTYGVYQVVTDLTVSPVTLTDPAQIIAINGDEALVRKVTTNDTDDRLMPNTVVKNTLSGEYGVVSGNLLIVANNAAAIDELQSTYGLSIVSQTNGSNLVLVKAADNTDLTELSKTLKASGLVKSIKLDITEKRYISR